MIGSASVPELDSMWHKLANNPQVLQHMFSLPYTKTVLEGLEASPTLAQQVLVASHTLSVVIMLLSLLLLWTLNMCQKTFIFCSCSF